MTDNTQELDEILRSISTPDDWISDEAYTLSIGDAKQAIIDWHNKQMEAYHNELTDNEKKVWIYADDLEKRKARAVEEVLDRLLEQGEDFTTFGDGSRSVAVEYIEVERNKLKEYKHGT